MIINGFRIAPQAAKEVRKEVHRAAITRLRLLYPVPEGFLVREVRRPRRRAATMVVGPKTPAKPRCLPPPIRRTTHEICLEIRRDVCRRHGVTLAQMDGDGRTREVVAARHEAIALCWEVTGLSPTRMGRIFRMDHTSILYALRKTGRMPVGGRT